MKKLIFCIALFFLLIPVAAETGRPAYAAVSTPHVVISGEVWLLSESGEKLFLLPDTYYARINNLDDAYYFVTFNGVSGKVSKNVVSTTGYHTAAAGTTAELQVSDSYVEFVSINLKAAPSLSSQNVTAIPVADSFTFIGEYPSDDGIWYYIKYNQYYGYIRSERTNVPDMNIAAFVPEVEPVETVTEPEQPEDTNTVSEFFSGLEGNTLRIIVIVALAVPALIIIFVLFRPSKGRKEKYYD